jgi:hypothetical protein
MKHTLLIGIVLGIVFISFGSNQALAALSGAAKGFGGRITFSTRAQNIEVLEATYKCTVPGSSFSITPVGSTTAVNYLVPAGTVSKTGTTPRVGQWVLGLYQTFPTTIGCVLKEGTGATTTTLNSTNLYGTSK